MSARNEGNRKMKEVVPKANHATLKAAAHQVNLFNLHGHHSASPSNARHSQVQQLLNNASNNPLLQASLLAAADLQGAYNFVPTDIKNQIEDIDRIIESHNEHLRQQLDGLMGKMAKKLKEKEVELQQKMAENAELERVLMHYRTEVERLQMTVRYLEQVVVNVPMRSGLQEGTATSRCSETGEENEAIFTALKLECRNCKREMAKVMLWPCRHVCLCRRCDADLRIMFCPVCGLMKTGSLEVYISPSEY